MLKIVLFAIEKRSRDIGTLWIKMFQVNLEINFQASANGSRGNEIVPGDLLLPQEVRENLRLARDFFAVNQVIAHENIILSKFIDCGGYTVCYYPKNTSSTSDFQVESAIFYSPKRKVLRCRR